MIKNSVRLIVANKKQYSSKLDERRRELMQKGLPKQKAIDGVKDVIVVASSKGGVGKSTVATNLAISLSQLQPTRSVGLLDLDIFGPSIPHLMNFGYDTNKPDLCPNTNKMYPYEKYGIKCMSMGFLIDNRKPIIWRGLLVMQAIDNLLRNINWNQIDYLVIDTPPGTGDTQLSLIQNVPISGVVLVTLPQQLSIKIVHKSIAMFKMLKVPIIGTVLNMAYFKCPNCSNSITFNNTKNDTNINVLERIPLDFSSTQEDNPPITVTSPDHPVTLIYKNLAKYVNDFITKK